MYQFVLMYIIGAYINLFYKEKSINKNIFLLIYIALSTILAIVNIKTSRAYGYNMANYSYNYVIIFISSISLFLFFKEVNIKSSFINKLSSLTLGVYLIHDHPYIRSYIYNYLNYYNYYNYYDKKSLLVSTLVVISIIFIGSSIL